MSTILLLDRNKLNKEINVQLSGIQLLILDLKFKRSY